MSSDTVLAGTYRCALHDAMHLALTDHDNAIVLGQGVADHKSFFGTTTGLAEKFGPERVIETPIMEEGSTGAALGMALAGDYPIMTHLRLDFCLLAMNQMINLAAKYRYMFGGKFRTPMLFRLVVGRSWGQGPQHSQSLQATFAHFPGLTVIAPTTPEAIRTCYAYAIDHIDGPVISLEHRLLYELSFSPQSNGILLGETPFSARRMHSGSDVTIVATSIMALESLRAARHLEKHGISCDVIDLNSLSPLDAAPILESLSRTGKLLVADTGWARFGVGSEIVRQICLKDPGLLRVPPVFIGMADAPCPTAKTLEDLYYPNLAKLVDAVAKLVTGKFTHPIELPTESSMADLYKSFKGPF